MPESLPTSQERLQAQFYNFFTSTLKGVAFAAQDDDFNSDYSTRTG